MEVLVLGVHSDVSGSLSHPHSLTPPPHLWCGEGVPARIPVCGGSWLSPLSSALSVGTFQMLS